MGFWDVIMVGFIFCILGLVGVFFVLTIGGIVEILIKVGKEEIKDVEWYDLNINKTKDIK